MCITTPPLLALDSVEAPYELVAVTLATTSVSTVNEYGAARNTENGMVQVSVLITVESVGIQYTVSCVYVAPSLSRM